MNILILSALSVIAVSSETGDVVREGETVSYSQRAEAGKAFFSLVCDFPEWEADAYVFLPACAYNGNRDARETYTPVYPPRTTAEGSGPDPVLERSQYPALRADGSGEIAVTSGDLSVPCAGVWMPGAKKGFLVFTEQQVGGLNIGFTVRHGMIRVDFPADRRRAYRSCTANAIWPDPKLLLPSGGRVEARVKTMEFDAADVSEFLERFFRERKCLVRSERAPAGYTESLWRVTEEAWNSPALWSGECYHQEPPKYVPGWTGGPHHVYPLYKLGGPVTRERAVATLDFQTRHQAKSGYYYGRVVDGRDVVDEELCGPLDCPGRTLVRKTAECLYFFIRCGRQMGWRDSWRESCRKAADALVKTWREEGQFGQWVDVETGRVLVGRSTSAAIAPAALLDAWREFGRDEYRLVAFESCEAYCRDLDRGVTYGGPGDALMAPDSESAFALLESCVALAEETKDPKWIERSRRAAALSSTWVMSYSYVFPEKSTFGRLGINTVGAVFANAQNKHAAPGICTLSGDSLLRLYRLTGDKAYLELCKDIAYFIPQCVSRPDRPIYAKEGGADLPPGWVNERVNTSDFAGFGQVGEIFLGACWSGTSLLMSWADLMSQPEFDEPSQETK